MFNINYIPGNSHVYVRIQAFWSPGTARRYFAALAPYLDAQRRDAGTACVLVDRRGSPIQAAEVVAETISEMRRFYRADDRAAIVVDTSLLKLQMSRIYPQDTSRVFVSANAGRIWLEGEIEKLRFSRGPAFIGLPDSR
jgi:tRNA(Ile2) C34 agmatinyltransferase TiaS